MQILRRPETAQGAVGFWESSSSKRTRTADAEVARAVQSFRGEKFFSTLFELISLFEQISEDEDVCAVHPGAFASARDLLLALPAGYVVPEVAVDPDGEIALDWIRPDRTMVSVSVGSGRITYAASLRDGTAHGVIRRTAGFPQLLTEPLRRLYHPA